MTNDFAVYCGDDFLFIGTKHECLEHFGWNVSNFYKLSSPHWIAKSSDKNRKIVIRIEEDAE